MACDARSGLKPASNASRIIWNGCRNGLRCPFGVETDVFPLPPSRCQVGMACDARSGLKHQPRHIHLQRNRDGRNGLRCPFGVETSSVASYSNYPTMVGMACDARSGLKPAILGQAMQSWLFPRRNGLRCPFGVETFVFVNRTMVELDVGMACDARLGVETNRKECCTSKVA